MGPIFAMSGKTRVKGLFLLFILITISSFTFSQTDNAGPGRAISFDGIDDYIDLGNIYDDLRMPFTISAWVYAAPFSGSVPIFVSQDNDNIYNGFWFCLSSTKLYIEYGDGRGEQNNAYRKGKTADVPNIQERWIHISAVVNSGSDIKLYVNGVNVGGASSGSSNLPMASNFPSSIAKIGYFLTNSIVYRFKGLIDELRIWNRSLSEAEIRETMCRRLKGDEPGLIGYWNFDETGGNVVKDLSSNGFDGTMIGNPIRVYSGAPIGSESVYLYTTNWLSRTLVKDDLTIANISGTPFGLHIYSVNNEPSQTGGLTLAQIQLPYYGVFIADDGGTNSFDLGMTEAGCQVMQRSDNSEPQWHALASFSGVTNRIELIRGSTSTDVDVELGPDVLLCDKTSYVLGSTDASADRSYLWSTGETNSTITVKNTGRYAVQVTEGCSVDADSVNVTFRSTPPAFSLGKDETSCLFEPRTLTAALDTSLFTITWQDGSNDTAFVAQDFGTYWLKVENECGVEMDSITFSREELLNLRIYNFMSPDAHDELNQYFVVDERLLGCQLFIFNRWGKEVYVSRDYRNLWDANGLPSGIYFYTISHPCIDPMKGTLTIMH